MLIEAFVALPFILYLLISVTDYYSITDVDDYFLAGRNLSTTNFVVNASVTNYSFLTLVFVLGFWGYAYGSGAWWTIITMITGFVLFTIKAISPAGQPTFLREGSTLHEYLGATYDSQVLRVTTAMMTSVAYLGYFIASIYVAATFFAPVLNVGVWVLLAVIAAAIITYTVLGGYQSVVRTDDLQILFIVCGCLVITHTVLGADLTSIASQATAAQPFLQPARGIPYIISLFFLNGLWQLFAMDMWQRSIATSDSNQTIKGSLISGLVWTVIAIPVVIMGLFVATQGIDATTPTAVVNAFTDAVAAEWLVAVFYASLVGALISSQDSNLAALSQAIHTDVWSPTDSNASLRSARWTVALAGVIGVGFLYVVVAVLGFDLVTFLLTFFSTQLIVLPALLVKFIRDGDETPARYALWSVGLGFASAVVFGAVSLSNTAFQFLTPIISLGFAALPFLYRLLTASRWQ